MVQPAFAETWRTATELIPEKSLPTCQGSDLSKFWWDISFQDNVVSGVSSTGAKFSSPVAPDGSFKVSIRSSAGTNSYPLDIVGNAKSREIESYNQKFSCRYRMVPK
jgi:hypothetical protein